MYSFSVYRIDVPPRSVLSPYEPLQCQEYSIPYWGLRRAKVHCRGLPKGSPQLAAHKLHTPPRLEPTLSAPHLPGLADCAVRALQVLLDLP